MNLKCICRIEGHLEEEEVYDVAEIEGHPFHVMVRLPDGTWPAPFHPLHSLHPEEFFEMPDTPIEVRSDGYECQYVEMFGLMLVGDDCIDDDDDESDNDGVTGPYIETYEDVLTEHGRGRVAYVGYCFNQFVKVGSTDEARRRVVSLLERLGRPADPSKIRYWCFEHYAPRRGKSE